MGDRSAREQRSLGKGLVRAGPRPSLQGSAGQHGPLSCKRPCQARSRSIRHDERGGRLKRGNWGRGKALEAVKFDARSKNVLGTYGNNNERQLWRTDNTHPANAREPVERMLDELQAQGFTHGRIVSYVVKRSRERFVQEGLPVDAQSIGPIVR